jgi:hypothetical protein
VDTINGSPVTASTVEMHCAAIGRHGGGWSVGLYHGARGRNSRGGGSPGTKPDARPDDAAAAAAPAVTIVPVRIVRESPDTA